MKTLDDLYFAFHAAMAAADRAKIEDLLQGISTVPDSGSAALSTLFRAGLHHLDGAFAEGIADASSAKEQYQALGDDRGVIRCNILLLMIYQSLGDHSRSLELCHENMHLNKSVQEPNVEGGSLTTIGLMYRATGNYPAAIEYLERALAIFIEQGNRAFVANGTCNIGGLYFYLDQFENAVRYLEEGIAMQREVGNVEYEIGQSLALAKTLYSMGREDEGERLMTKMYHRAIEFGAPSLIANAVIDLARNAVYRHRFEEALELLESQHHVIEPLPQWGLERDTVRSTALANLEQYTDAKSVLNAAIERATTLNLKPHLQNYHRILRDIAKEENDFDSYIHHNDIQQRLLEELKGAESARKLALLEGEKKITALNQQRERERSVLYSALPQHVADRMIRGEAVNDLVEHAVVLFADIVSFTTHTSQLLPHETTVLLAEIFETFDTICREHGLVKIKTIGDSYMAVAFGSEEGVNGGKPDVEHRAAQAARRMNMSEFFWPTSTDERSRVQFRIGMHSGPVVAGVVGKERLQYDVWGDTVNTASRMESTGEPGRIQVSNAFHVALLNNTTHADRSMCWTTERGAIEIKGKGTMSTFWLEWS